MLCFGFCKLGSRYKNYLLYKFATMFLYFHRGTGDKDEFSLFTNQYANVTTAHLAEMFTLNHTVWPMQTGYIGLEIQNLNDYVELFKHCLINIQNYQGIELVGLRTPVYITRFDVDIIRCITRSGIHFATVTIHLRRHTNQERFCKLRSYFKYEHKTTKPGWSCFVQFDLFHPEVHQAPHFFHKEAVLYGRNVINPHFYEFGTTAIGKVFWNPSIFWNGLISISSWFTNIRLFLDFRLHRSTYTANILHLSPEF